MFFIVWSTLTEMSGLLVTALASFGVLGYTLINFQTRMSELKVGVSTKLADNPMRGLVQNAVESVQLEWGWAILVVGAGLLVAAAAIGSARELR